MDLKKIGIVIIFISIIITIVFIDNQRIFVPALTFTILGFLITIIGFIGEVKKRKVINDRLDEDITSIIQPLITKYSNLNKEYRRNFEGDEYVSKRLELNQDLERDLTNNLPYLEKREIKKIVIQFSQEQDKL